MTERDKDALRKRNVRTESARIEIPDCKNPARREACLADPIRFMRTYFGKRYTRPFERDLEFIIETCISRARDGGRQAVAAPRGRGKTEVSRGVLPYLICREIVRFPLAIEATSALGHKTYVDIKNKFAHNDLLLEDFPEICYPIRALEGAPQRAGRQHIDGKLTKIVWTDEYISFPHVHGSPFGGVKMAYYGLDAAFRGCNYEGDRPDFVLINDPETRESAKSVSQIEDREQIIDRDIAGLADSETNLPIVVLTTVQNSYCLSARLTDRNIKPSWNGVRFGLVTKWPASEDHWKKYIELRQDAQIKGDEYGRPAVEYYLANREAMNDGVEMLTDQFIAIASPDGFPLVYSSIQQAYNRIADTSRDAFFTEYQNDPPAESGPVGNGVTWDLVASRISGLPRGFVPGNTMALTAAIDLGKYRCHWVVIAWWQGAGGCVIDYGVAEVVGTSGLDNEASEPKIYEALLNWRDQLLAKEYTDTAGERRRVSHCLVDSGAYTNAAYEFVRQSQGIFHASKGISNYTPRKKNTATTQAGANLHREFQPAKKLWLYELNTDYWKQFVHERFLTATFDEHNMLRRSSLSLYTPEGSARHASYANHIAAEELVELFVDGKGVKRYWSVKSDNNHWLDATYMACACTELCGIKLLNSETKLVATQVDGDKPKSAPVRIQHGNNRFRTRPGGWVKGIRRR